LAQEPKDLARINHQAPVFGEDIQVIFASGKRCATRIGVGAEELIDDVPAAHWKTSCPCLTKCGEPAQPLQIARLRTSGVPTHLCDVGPRRIIGVFETQIFDLRLTGHGLRREVDVGHGIPKRSERLSDCLDEIRPLGGKEPTRTGVRLSRCGRCDGLELTLASIELSDDSISLCTESVQGCGCLGFFLS
jgi:hypothetical protein